MKLLTAMVLFAAVASAQGTPANPLTLFRRISMPWPKRTFLVPWTRSRRKCGPTSRLRKSAPSAQLFAHVADGQYEFCGVAAEGKSVSKDIEKTKKTKAEIVPALKDAFAYCDAAYANMTDAHAADMVSFFGMKITKLGVMDFNIAHTMEHYGNLVTYMRIKGIVPPSSAQQPPARRLQGEVARHDHARYFKPSSAPPCEPRRSRSFHRRSRALCLPPGAGTPTTARDGGSSDAARSSGT